jgi:NAD(P)-dependent dehydrogenase (short-subunit alcohol dehydrogenase family)
LTCVWAANGGIGRETIRQLISRGPGWHYLLTIRDPEDENSALLKDVIKSAPNSDASQVELLKLDLGALHDVHVFALEISKRIQAGEIPAISHLVAQAGTQFQTEELHWNKETPKCEMTFAVNHLSHALLCSILLPVLHTEARIITLASSSHDPAEGWGIPVNYKSIWRFRQIARPRSPKGAFSDVSNILSHPYHRTGRRC